MSSKTIWLVGLLALVLSLLTPSRRLAAENYSITDLGTLGGSQSRAYGVNDLGQVVGESRTVTGDSHAFLWLPEPAYGQPAGMNDLGTLGGAVSAAFDINNNGIIVGRAETTDPTLFRAFLWDPGIGNMQELATPEGPAEALAINDFGEVAGTGVDEIGFSQAFYRSAEGTIVFFSTLVPGDFVSQGSGLGYAGNINFAGTTFFPAHAFKFGGETGFIPLEDLGVESFVYGMNVLNQTVGSVVSDDWEHAALWGFIISLTDLGTLGGTDSRAYAINDMSEVIGFADTTRDIQHAFVWQAGTMTDLNDLLPPGANWQLEVARDINESGQIVGRGIAPNGQMHAFLLTTCSFADLDGDCLRCGESENVAPCIGPPKRGVYWGCARCAGESTWEAWA